ncbi:branched-chain amino acid ABC transporter permease [Candidatus Viridilinea mediisalina]|uniref:Branched-chain amino acid ABC transporter permease n=1 Tax=Candidatus Viridilinea mediisalina TaxID=2024553 RepID=A0A2A6RH57_9CHLR|nr:branched-chain amino acid ABC transporter permease [Candidatus Viridilinea mediisalina]PDW02219.1 branched-chain amino acid ABC transporter permease [Candidatus Viridilinea mediisalina]
MAAEVNAPASARFGRRSPLEVLRTVFGPVFQLFLFIVGSALALSLIVVLLALMQMGSRPDILTRALTILPQVIIDGLVRGFLFATIALGYTMVYGVLEFINFAHGEIFMVGGIVGAAIGLMLFTSGMLAGVPVLLFVAIVVLAGMVVSGSLAVAVERVAYRPLRGSPRLVPLISAIGVSLVLQDVVRLIVTNTPMGFNARYHTPDFGSPIRLFEIDLGERVVPVIVSPKALVFISVALLMLIGLNYLVNATRLGKAIRATAQDRPTASLMGINVNRIISLTFLIGGALGGAAGALFGLNVGAVNPYMGFIPGLKAFTAAVLGGIGNITGAMVGGVVLGFLEAFVSSYLSLFTNGALSGAAYADIAAFSILILILIFRPSGLLGEATTQKV